MIDIVKWLDALLIDKLHINPEIAEPANTALLIVAMLLIAIGTNWLIQSLFRWFTKRSKRLAKSKWHHFLVKRKLGHHLLLLLPGLILYILPYIAFGTNTELIRTLHRFDIAYMLIVVIMILNALMFGFLDFYMTTDKNRIRPLQGLIQGLQVILYFVGAIIIIAILIDKSPTVLLTGLGASAAVLMLIFKDSILGFVAGVQLAQNDMIKLQLGEAFSLGLLTHNQLKNGEEIIFFSERLQYASWTTKVGAIEKLMGLGIMSLNESRAILGLEPVEGGDKRLQSLNYVDASKANKYQVDEDDNPVKKEDNEDEKQ